MSVTIEAAYDDWCIAQKVKSLGRTADYDRFIRMTHNYMEVIDSSMGFMAPRSADGNWVKGFNPTVSDTQALV